MYGYEEDYTNISIEQVLQKVSQQQIFEWILGEPFNINGRYRSPFREDKNPGCKFIQREDGTILFLDFGDKTGGRHRSCFGMVIEAYKTMGRSLTLNMAVKEICKHFNISRDTKDYSPIIVKLSDSGNYTKTDNSSPAIITYDKKDYIKKDKLYWSKFIITIDNLLEDTVFSASSFKVIGKKGLKITNPYSHCYVIDFINHVKIYQPYGYYRFISNCDEDDIGNFDNLPPTGETLIIQKAYKDHRTLRNIGFPNVIWFMNEGAVPSIYILENLLTRFHRIIIFFDNDYQGISAGYKLYKILISLSSKLQSNNIVEMKYIPIKIRHKDIGAFVEREGKKDLIKLVKQIKL